MMDWNDPIARARLCEQVGIQEYNRRHDQFRQKQIVKYVNGYPIRQIFTQQFGYIYMVDGTSKGFPSLREAEVFAGAQPMKLTPGQVT